MAGPEYIFNAVQAADSQVHIELPTSSDAAVQVIPPFSPKVVAAVLACKPFMFFPLLLTQLFKLTFLRFKFQLYKLGGMEPPPPSTSSPSFRRQISTTQLFILKETINPNKFYSITTNTLLRYYVSKFSESLCRREVFGSKLHAVFDQDSETFKCDLWNIQRHWS